MKNHYKLLFASLFALCLLFHKRIYEALQFENSVALAKQAKMSGKVNALLPDSTVFGIRHVIARREYHITFDKEAGVFQSPNRRQNLRASYAPGVLTLKKRVDSTHSDFTLKLVNNGIFGDGKLLYAVSQDGRVNTSENKVVIDHGHFSEEFVNNEDGVRQNFMIESAPAGMKWLAVKLAVSGATVLDKGKNELRFKTEAINGASPEELVYNGLKCWDANGQILDATLAYQNGQIEITADVEHATFPVMIDPLMSGGPAVADKRLEIHQSSAWLGYSVSSAGDVNGDGYSDVIIGAPKYDNGQTDEGAAFVFPGTAGGLSLAGTVLQSNQANAQAGTSVSSAGDVNKDGYSDVLVGAPYYDAGQTDEGVVFVYLGGASGLTVNPVKILEINQNGANFGISVAMAGDVNGDGHSDILVGAHQYDNGQLNEGAAFLFHGNAGSVGAGAVALEANQAGAMMGYAVASAGDLDADGFSDVMVGARLYSNGQTYEGAVFVYKGSAAGVVKTNPHRIESNQIDARFGHSIAPAGDVDGDGFSDIIIGAYLYDQSEVNTGSAYLYFGTDAGTTLSGYVTFAGYQKESWYGWAVAGAGDVNGDGYSDIMVGARYHDSSKPNEGAAFVYFGNAEKIFPFTDAVILGEQQDAWLGSALASAGDVNGDGYSDLVIGAYPYDNGQTDEGTALIYHGGGVAGHDASRTVLSDSVGLRQFGSVVADAGDINADGYDDVIISSPGTDPLAAGRTTIAYGSREGVRLNWSKIIAIPFGRTVAGAGDVNGDGYADVVIGNPNYNNTGNGGETRIYYGSPTGIDTLGFEVLTEANNGSLFGSAVAGAGDLNGDHFADVVVGAPKYKVGNEARGAAFVYYGSASGLITTPKILEGKSNNASMGASVAGLGDTNGDHYGDLVIGAPTTNTAAAEGGMAWIYYGAAGGVDMSNTFFKNDNTNAHFGASVAGAGDVNGDGYNEAIVGIPNYGVSNEGGVAVYHGAAAGFTESSKRFYPGGASNMLFGISVSSAGDVNADGYSDILIGASIYSTWPLEAGRFSIILGSRYGLSNWPDWSVVGQGVKDHFGTSVSGAGDVNGDGFSDFIIGIPGRDAASPDAGSVHIYIGGGQYEDQLYYPYQAAKPARLMLYNADMNTPYAQNYPGQNTQTQFGIGLAGRSFLGRNKGKLIWETKGMAQPFSSMPNSAISNSVQSTGSQPSFTNLLAFGTVLKSLVGKLTPETKVRARIKYDPVLALTGQMYGPWRYLPTFLTGKSIAPPPQEIALRMQAERLENAVESVSIYPNPASETLFIRSSSQNTVTGVKLVTAGGTVVFNRGKAPSEIDLKGFEPGMYILITKHADGSEMSHKVAVRK